MNNIINNKTRRKPNKYAGSSLIQSLPQSGIPPSQAVINTFISKSRRLTEIKEIIEKIKEMMLKIYLVPGNRSFQSSQQTDAFI